MMPMKNELRTIPFYASAVVLTGTCGTIAGIAALAGDRAGRIWWPASRLWARGFLQSAGVTDFIVKGDEVMYDGAPYVLMANHQSHLDPPALIRSSERPIGFLTKKELERIPVFGWAVRATGHVFIDRKNRDKSFASIDRAAAQVAEGRCILVFPEGTRSTTEDLLPFKKGGFVLAIKAGVPIIPVGVAGTRRILPAQSPVVVGRGPVSIVYGQPIPTAGATIDDKDGIMDEVRRAILVLRAEAEALIAGRT
ncbi:MAG: 1-acyl-sn-glycerol-3-phosphate acyltransferase [Deltaproteobacteria bacterium]|nr:1-acyl-sn-glycerol-3-phosphate acyltransferase [Deltaproteobacteria bacterium]